MGADDDEQRLHAALVEELMRKSSLCWLRLEGAAAGAPADHPAWHVWHEGAAYVVSGGSEQPLPGIASAGRAVVVARTKDTRQRLLAWEAEVATLSPGSPEWQEAVAALVGARLNLRDLDGAADRWARECVVSRLNPTGSVAEPPDALPDDGLSAVPRSTSATTRRGLPRVLHRRQTRGPDLRGTPR